MTKSVYFVLENAIVLWYNESSNQMLGFFVVQAVEKLTMEEKP